LTKTKTGGHFKQTLTSILAMTLIVSIVISMLRLILALACQSSIGSRYCYATVTSSRQIWLHYFESQRCPLGLLDYFLLALDCQSEFVLIFVYPCKIPEMMLTISTSLKGARAIFATFCDQIHTIIKTVEMFSLHSRFVSNQVLNLIHRYQR